MRLAVPLCCRRMLTEYVPFFQETRFTDHQRAIELTRLRADIRSDDRVPAFQSARSNKCGKPQGVVRTTASASYQPFLHSPWLSNPTSRLQARCCHWRMQSNGGYDQLSFEDGLHVSPRGLHTALQSIPSHHVQWAVRTDQTSHEIEYSHYDNRRTECSLKH